MLILQGLSVAAVIMLCLNLLTIQGPTIYNVSAAACHLLRSERRRTLTLAAAGVGIVLAIGGMYEMLIPFLVLLGSIIPPIGGVILADYWFARGGRYPLLQNARLPRFNWAGTRRLRRRRGGGLSFAVDRAAGGDLRLRAGLYRPDSAKQTPACRRRGAGAMSLTVSELLALEGLSALRLRAGKQGLQRAVRWYYVAENEHIAEWIMGGELVFITGINHPRDEANLIQLLMEGKQRGIAGMVILTGEAYIHAIPATLIALADELGMPLIEQPYLLKMVIVTERIGTALVRSENVLQSQRDILMQLVTGDYPDLQMLHQRALHQQLDFTRPLRLAALRLEGLSRLFRQFPPEQAEAWLLQAHRSVRQQLQQQLNQQGNSFPLLERSNMFLFLLPDEEGEGFQQKKWLQQWLQALADGEEGLSLLCGLSAPVRQLQGYPRALSQARQALDLCDTLRPTQRISDYQQLGFIKLLSAVSDPALLNDFMHDTLGCLIEPGRKAPWLLLETLETLLQENGNVVRAADRLGLHRNTLHQRIQRIEKLTGYPVSHPQFHLNASVALVIWRLSQNHLQDPP